MRVLVAEDSVVLRDGLVRLLTARQHEVVAEVADADALLPAVREHRPDVAVIDVRMPPTHTDDGLRAAIALREEDSSVGILVFSQYVEKRYASRLLALGADGVGYLLKDRIADVSDFLDALDRVARGGTAFDPEVITQLVHRTKPSGLDGLTPRERDVLELMAQGRSNGAIARDLVVSAGAVEKYVSSIFGKLGLPVSEDDHRRVLAVIRYLQD